jgi:hypothetical protein
MSDNDQRLASLNEARDQFIKALKTHEHFVYRLGYEAGFTAGWDAVVRRLASTKPDLTASTDHQDLTDLLHRHESEIPARDTLIAIVLATPGLERHEIIVEAQKRLPSLSERTVRTALQRLKNAGELQVDDGKWYVTEKRGPARRVMKGPDEELI